MQKRRFAHDLGEFLYSLLFGAYEFISSLSNYSNTYSVNIDEGRSKKI